MSETIRTIIMIITIRDGNNGTYNVFAESVREKEEA